MEGAILGINAEGNPVIYDKTFPSMLGKLPTTTTLIDDNGHIITDSLPGPSNSGGPSTTPLLQLGDELDLLGLTGDKCALSFINCIRNAFDSNDPDILERWLEAGEALLKETIDTSSPTELDEEAKARVKNHPSVANRTMEIDESIGELYMLFPPAAAKSHGSRAISKLGGMWNKYKDDPACVLNQDRILLLLEIVKQASGARITATRAVTKQEQQKVERESKLAKQKPPKVHLAREVNQAHAHAEEMTKVVNLPKPSEQLKVLDSIKNLPHFGEGLLSAEGRKFLSSAEAKSILEAAEAEEAQEPEDRLADEEIATHEANGAPKIVTSSFTDVDELRVLDVDLVETKKEWMARLVEPLIIEEFYNQLAKEHDGKFPCLLCRALPEKLKPVSAITKKKGKDIFDNRAKLDRHEEQVHTPWFDLMQYMITDDPETFKCPTTDCPFRAGDIEDVRDHCVENCKEQEVYQDMQRKFEQRQQEKRDAGPSRVNLKFEKLKQELRGHGHQLDDKTIEGVNKISITSPKELFELADRYKIPKSEVQPHIRGLEGLIERARLSIGKDGLVKDPYVDMPMEEVSKLMLNPEMDAEFDALVAKKTEKWL